MFDIALVGNGAFDGSQERAIRPESQPAKRPGHDRAAVVTTADLSRWQGQLDRMDDVRWNRVREARASIERGEYLTGQRLDAAIDGLLRDLGE